MCRVSCTFKSWGHTYCTPVGLILNMWNTAPGQPALPPSVFPLPFKQYTVSVFVFLVLFFMLKSKKKEEKKRRNDYVITPPKFPHVPVLDSIPLTGKIIHKVANIYWSYIIAEASWASSSTFFQRYSPPAQVCLLTPLLFSSSAVTSLRTQTTLSTPLTNTLCICRRLLHVFLSLHT